MSTEEQESDRNHQGRFKGMFSSKIVPPSNALKTRSRSEEKANTSRHTSHPMAATGADDFLPNPQIPSSPESPLTKKIWEGAYKNFLSRGKNKSPANSSGGDRSPSSISSENSRSIKSETNKKKNSGFSILPGSKRLVSKAVSNTPQSVTAIRPTQSNEEINGLPKVPSLGAKIKSFTGIEGVSGDGDSENAVRGGSYFKSVFSQRSTNEKLSRHRKSYSAPSIDDLDVPLRNGVHKTSSSPEYRKAFMSDPDIGQTISEGENDNVGLDYLLESASTPTLFGSQTHLPLQPMPPSIPPPHMVQTRSSSWAGYQTEIVEDFDGVRIPVLLPPRRPRQVANVSHPHPDGGGSLLSQQLQQHQHDPITGLSDQPTQLSSDPNTLASYLSDPSFTVDSSPSSTVYQQQQAIDPETKKVFTMYHNDSRFNRDSTEPFLGGDVPSSYRNYPDVSYNLTLAPGGGSLISRSRSSSKMHPPMNVSASLPLEPVDEQSILIQQNLRLLKPVQGCESWQNGRRYLIAAAAIASCPLTVVDKLSGTRIRSAVDAASSPVCFGTVSLGEALMTYIGEKHHLSLGKWSSCALILRQNYLLEYDVSAPTKGLPRGFAHLEHANAYPSLEFSNSLELHFFASPCAKSDPRVLLIRVSKREERDHWVTCLNRAARLRVDDLWEFETEEEFGRGRYASVRPARRKDEKYFEQKDQEPKAAPTNVLQRCSCALKIVDKNEFWRRVVKGRERADTLVRELSVQSTLTAKCGQIPTFLKLRSFFETSDNVVLELELLEGTDLFDYISQKGMLKEEEAALITQDILQSLEAMNRVGMAHRDLKPANILMCNREKDNVSVKVGDFGMSTFVGVDGLVRGRCGTPGYVAPEILTASSGVGYGNKVDVFSAGVILYVMLCGYEPYYGESEKDLVDANKLAIVDFPESDWRRVSQEARDLIRQMLKPDPKKRITAKDALEHPWIVTFGTKAIESSGNGSGLNKSIHLPPSDVPDAGACIIA